MKSAPASVLPRRGVFGSARLAVSLMFLANGFLIGSWAPKIPEFAERLRLSESALGVMIFFFGIGSLVAMPLIGAAIARRGSRLPLKITAAATILAMPAVTAVPSPLLGAAALFLFGAVIGGMDVAMNANAVAVERREGRAIMSSCHGFWSLGGVIGAPLGGLMIEGPGVTAHAVAATVIAALAIGFSFPRLIADHTAPGEADGGTAKAGPASVFSAGAAVWLLGVMCLFSMLPEGATLDWSALYLRRELGADIALSGLAFGAFSATMAIMRFAGDLVRDRFGAVRTLRVSALLAMAGLIVAGLAADPVVAIAGFAIAGIGLANIVPICFSAAGNLPGLPPGVAISFVTFMGYSGILFAPSIIGFVAERTGFAAVYAALSLMIAFVLAMSGLARHADRA